LAYAAEVPHPEELAEQLVVLFDGAGISAWLDRRPSTVNTWRAIASAAHHFASNSRAARRDERLGYRARCVDG